MTGIAYILSRKGLAFALSRFDYHKILHLTVRNARNWNENEHLAYQVLR